MKNVFLAVALATLSLACATEKKASVSDAAPAATPTCASKMECSDEMKAACSDEMKAECATKKAECSTEAKTCPVTGKTLN